MRNEFWYPPGFPWEDEWFLQWCALAMAVLAGFVAFLLQFSAALEALQAELLLHQAAELPDDLLAMPPLPRLMGGFGICFLLLGFRRLLRFFVLVLSHVSGSLLYLIFLSLVEEGLLFPTQHGEVAAHLVAYILQHGCDPG